MKASYKLQLEQHQRRLGLTHKELNKLDRKHNDINLLRHLQSLEPKVSAPPEEEEPTGFWGDFVLTNETASGSSHRHLHAYLAYNDVPLTESHQINGNHSYIFSVLEEDRLPLPSSTLQLKVTMQNGTQELDLGAYEVFTITGITENPLNEENTLSMVVNSNNLNDGNCAMTFLVTYVPPPSGWSGTITFNRTGGGGDPYISLRTDTQVITTDYDYNNESDTFSVSLTTPQSYVEIAFTLYGDWGMYSHSFSSYFGNPYIYYDQATDREWYRYTIMPNIQSNLAFNFTTFYND